MSSARKRKKPSAAQGNEEDFLSLLVDEVDVNDMARSLKYMRQSVDDRTTVRGHVLVGTTNAHCVDSRGRKIPGMCSANAAASFLVYLGVLPEEYAIHPHRMYIDFVQDLDRVNMPINESFAGVVTWGLTRMHEHVAVIVDYYDDALYAAHLMGFDMFDEPSTRMYFTRDSSGEMVRVEDVAYLAGAQEVLVLTNWLDDTRPHADLFDDLRSDHVLPDQTRRVEWLGSGVCSRRSIDDPMGHVAVMVPRGDGVEILDSNIPEAIHDVEKYRRYTNITNVINVFRL